MDHQDGTRTLSCADGSSVTLADGTQGQDGANGSDGADGTDGANGSDGIDGSDGAPGSNSLVRQDPEAGGPKCPFSGVYIRSGVDDNGDGVLQDEEIDAEMLICSTQPGPCAEGYAPASDLACAFVNPCDSDNGGCDIHASCSATTPDDLSCQCLPGYTGDGYTCTFDNPCDDNNGGCDTNATCSATPNNQSCTCNDGYTGDGYTCTFVSPCDTNNGGCSANAICSITNTSEVECSCAPGFEGDGQVCSFVCGAGTQALEGKLVDQDGRLVPGTSGAPSLNIWVQSPQGTARTQVQPNGYFAACVPEGSVEVSLSNPSTGIFNRNDLPNSGAPYYISNIAPAIPWTSTDGLLVLSLPNTKTMHVNVRDGNGPVAGARVASSTTLTSDEFVLHEASNTRTTLAFQLGQATTDDDGVASFTVYDTDTPLVLTTELTMEGVAQSARLENVDVDDVAPTLVLPDPPQLLSGTLQDENGLPLPGTGHASSLSLWVQNNNGYARSNVDSNGEFSFYVPSGDVAVALAYPSTGIFNRNDTTNPAVPYYIKNITPAISWNSSDGDLALTLPATVPLRVRVTSGGTPVANANVVSDTTLTSKPFILHAASATSTTLQYQLGQATTDANGDATLVAYPSDTPFSITARRVVEGVEQRSTLADAQLDGGILEIVLPDPPQLLTGTLSDTNGNRITGPGQGAGLSLWAQNAEGWARSNVDTSGAFSFYVPGGSVDVSLAYPSTGIFNRNDAPNPTIPYYVHNISPAISWSESDGPLHFQLPAVVPVDLHIEYDGVPLANATLQSDQNLTSTAFELVAGDSSTQTTARFQAGSATTDANGNAVLYIWPTAGQTFDVALRANVTGATLTGTLTGIPADGTPQSRSFDLKAD